MEETRPLRQAASTPRGTRTISGSEPVAPGEQWVRAQPPGHLPVREAHAEACFLKCSDAQASLGSKAQLRNSASAHHEEEPPPLGQSTR